jgi:hypothetical protein
MMMSYIVRFSLVAICFFSLSLDFDMTKLLKKRVQKEVSKVFMCSDFKLNEVTGTPGFQLENSTFLTRHQIYKIDREGTLLGYAFIGTAPSKTDSFEYLILFDQNFIHKKAKVLVYREDYGGEISSKRWLSQFQETTLDERFTYGDNISAISGATISVKSMTNSINYVYAQLQPKKVAASH